MKKLFFCFLLSLLFFLFLSPTAHAHFAATDGNITIVLHVDPNDQPIPGQLAHLYFLFNFNDTTKKFSLRDCNCIVTVVEQGNQKQIEQQKLLEKNNPHLTIWGANMPIVFPARDVYFITIKGSPIKPNDFKPFYLTWFFRVDSTASGIVKQETNQGLSDIQQLLIGLAAVIIFLVCFGLFIKREMQQ
jgi:hypothetical protein